MPITIQDDGRDIDVQIEIDVSGYLYLKAYDGDVRVSELPKMTPFEASMIARELSRAAERADRR